MKSDLRLMSDACEMAGLAEEFDALVKERDALEEFKEHVINGDPTWEGLWDEIATRKEIEDG